jgi:hypothetical protein
MEGMRGLDLSRRFFHDCVEPILAERWPALRYSACLIGAGSEVLGFDDEVSRDHHWGPRVMLFLSPQDCERLQEPITSHLSECLPYTFLGYPTNFLPPDPADGGTQLLSAVESGPVRHRVEIYTVAGYLSSYLGIEDWRHLDERDWLTLPQQKLASVVGGDVFRDDAEGSAGTLAQMRSALSFYPRDVWLFQMAGAWARIGQEEHLMGRAGSVGDELGSALIAGRVARDVMRLCFLIERRYAPYAKWLGSAFRTLSCGPSLAPALHRAVTASTWQDRERVLVPAYEAVAALHNALAVTETLPTTAKQFFGRGFRVLAIHGFADALIGAIEGDLLTSVTRRSPIGGIDFVSDNTDVLEDPGFRASLRGVYDSRPV